MLTFFRLWAPLGMTLISRQENWHRNVTELKEGPGMGHPDDLTHSRVSGAIG